MASGIKVRAKVRDGVTEVKTLMKHVMETGTRKNSETGEIIPAHHITEVICEHKGNVVMKCNWGQAVSKNPYLAFMFKGAVKGDSIKVSWVDNKGESDSVEAEIK